jgi:hypothetical protein
VIGGGRLEWLTQLEEEYNRINNWAQEDVNTSYSLLHNNNSTKFKIIPDLDYS